MGVLVTLGERSPLTPDVPAMREPGLGDVTVRIRADALATGCSS